MSPLIRNDQANAELRQIQNAGNMKGAGIHAHAAVKTNQRNTVAEIRVRQAYAVDNGRHFRAQSNAAGGLGTIRSRGRTRLLSKVLSRGPKCPIGPEWWARLSRAKVCAVGPRLDQTPIVERPRLQRKG